VNPDEEATVTHDASHGLGRGLGAPASTADPPILAVPLTPEIAQKARRWLMVTGVLALLAGVVSILVPAVTSVTIAILVGVVLIVIAFPMAASAWAVPRRGRRALRLIEASLALIAGVCLVAFPLEGTLTLTFFLAAWFFATGALLLAAAPELRGTPMFWPTLLHGLASLLLGALIVADLPSSAAWAIGLLVGVNLVFYGVRALIAARELKQATTT
jgi:uncharacterized membrane protein HdeD (DUF308 family)